MLSCSSFTEEGIERVVATANGLVTGHLTVWLNTMFKAIQFPAGIANLNSCLTHVDGDTLALHENFFCVNRHQSFRGERGLTSGFTSTKYTTGNSTHMY